MSLPAPSEAAPRLKALAERWAGNTVNEKGSFQTWFLDLCDALGVPKPLPPTDEHRFELPVKVVERDGSLTTNFVDFWKTGHVAVEAKASKGATTTEVTTPKGDLFLRKAFGQVRTYVAHVPGTPPPYLMVVDVPKTLIVWDRWSGQYGDFGAGRRIGLATLHERPDDIALLQDILAQPAVRDPRGRAQAVTKDIAGKLATLAATFEDRGMDSERVARFLMRCVFCFFAEDVGLLPKDLFKRTLETARSAGAPEHVGKVLTSLWTTMDQGGMFGAELLHRFNGHFFQSVEALPLTALDVTLLIEASTFDWSGVEPSIFGTLLVRALDPEERHRLGAEYTPRAYIERLVEPTVVEPIRDRWTAVQAAVVQLEEQGGKKDKAAAVKQLRDFHGWLRALRFLDPACGSGNFLYVTMAAVKRIELEVISELERVAGKEQKEAILDEVHPRQFHGIEVKPWAREIAELTLWIGYHQFWRESHGGRTPPDPILEDTGTIECRDAVLAWDRIVRRPEKDRPDPTPRIPHPVTGDLVPDPSRLLPYNEYVGARPAAWPKADFIIGNPPYIGTKRMREALGDGYVDALRGSYPGIPASADLVLYWWLTAAKLVASGKTTCAGLITTNSIRMAQNRVVVETGMKLGAFIAWAVADHPWVDDAGGAAVRVAMTVLARKQSGARLVEVDDDGALTSVRVVSRLHSDLTGGASVASASGLPLLANEGLSSFGFMLAGDGFILTQSEATALIAGHPASGSIVRPYRNGRDLTARPRGFWLIDFGLMEEGEAAKFPQAFDRIRARVMPKRIASKREAYRRYWWRFGEPRRALRAMLSGLSRYVATGETAKHRFFQFLDTAVAPDHKLIAIALDDPPRLGVLSSTIHIIWALASGARLGVGNDPVYNSTRCFASFPFPEPSSILGTRIGEVAERLDSHRKDAIARDDRVTMTGMYNVVEKLRSGVALTPVERAIHEIAACGVLKDLHDELDRLVAQAYGWPWPMEREEILERLVALHDERVEEEKRGLIRWLRPDYQVPRFAPKQPSATLGLPDAEKKLEVVAPAERLPWPATAVEQLAALGGLIARGPVNAEAATAAFAGGSRKLVARHLETLELIGEVSVDQAGRYGKAVRVA